MNLVRLLVVVAVVAIAGLTQLTTTQAQTDPGQVDIEQSNLQVAVNIAVMCPGVEQSLEQFAVNTSIVAVNGDLNVDLTQTNVQVAYNIALLSPGSGQIIHQGAGNEALVATTGEAEAAVQQFNSQDGYSYSVASDGSVQEITQEVYNDAITITGSETLASSVFVVINQENVQWAMNLCIGAIDLDEVPDGWEECDGTWRRSPNAPSYAEAGGPEFTGVHDAPEWWPAFWAYWWGTCEIDMGREFPAHDPSPTTASPTPSPTATTGTGGTGSETTDDCLGSILTGSAPPADGGWGTFAFSGCTFEQLLAVSGCDASTSVFFHNLPNGDFLVWIPGAEVGAVNDPIMAHFTGDEPIPYGTIFTAKCV